MTEDPSRPLTDAEIAELDDLLAAIPAERGALDVAMLDGFLAGVLLAPGEVPVGAWLPHVFGTASAESTAPDEPGAPRATALVLRRYHELAAYLAAREPFDPIVFELTDDEGTPLEGRAGIAALAPWAAGLAHALDVVPALAAVYDADDAFAEAVGGVLRHLPVDADDTDTASAEFLRERARIDREVPLADLDDAIDELVACVLDAVLLSRPHRPVTRDAPKVGRNDPCPGGSGKKYNACHGRAGG